MVGYFGAAFDRAERSLNLLAIYLPEVMVNKSIAGDYQSVAAGILA